MAAASAEVGASSNVKGVDTADGQLRVGVRELRGNLTRYLRAAEQGALVFVTAHNAVIAEIHPPATQSQLPRVPGALRGVTHMSEQFEDDFPDDILDAMEE